MNKAFDFFLWQNGPSVETPLGESMLNKVNRAVEEIDNRVVNFDTTKANQADMLTAITSVSLDKDTGTFTFTKMNGATEKLDTLLEKLAINFYYDKQTQRLVITNSDGTIQYVDMKALITELEFLNSNTVLFSVVDGKVTANIAKGSITGDMLEPSYLANIQLYVSQALSYANQAEEYMVTTRGYMVNASTQATNAENSAARAEEAAEKAEEIAGGNFATNERVDNIINGTTPVGNALKLNGLTAEEFVINNNLLINADFKNPVNSSGKTSWTGKCDIFDMWSVNYDTTVTLNDGYITVKGDNNINQTSSFESGTYTLSFKARSTDGATMYFGVGGKSGNQITLTTEWVVYTFTANITTPFTTVNFLIGTASRGKGLSFDLEWAKLERGSVATPFIPPNKEVEKLKCGASGFMLDSLMMFDKIDDGADISALRDGIYWYNGYKASTITGDTLPFTSAWGLWIKKSQWNGTDRTGGRQDVVIRCKDGTVFTRNGTEEWTSKTDADTVDGAHLSDIKGWVFSQCLRLDGSVPMSGIKLAINGGKGIVRCDENSMGIYTFPITNAGNEYDSPGATGLVIYATNYAESVNMPKMERIKFRIDNETYTALHTGNKPSGSYTGNGDATARTINTGGIGNAILLWMNNGNVLVGPSGGIGNFYNSNHMLFSKNELKFENGILTIATSNLDVNADGFTVNYQVL